jgi:hypothetical protein
MHPNGHQRQIKRGAVNISSQSSPWMTFDFSIEEPARHLCATGQEQVSRREKARRGRRGPASGGPCPPPSTSHTGRVLEKSFDSRTTLSRWMDESSGPDLKC